MNRAVRHFASQILSPRGRGAVSIAVFRAALIVSGWIASSVSLAQAPTTAPAPASAIVGRSMTVEAIIVVVMVGAALFAICRGSRRN